MLLSSCWLHATVKQEYVRDSYFLNAVLLSQYKNILADKNDLHLKNVWMSVKKALLWYYIKDQFLGKKWLPVPFIEYCCIFTFK